MSRLSAVALVLVLSVGCSSPALRRGQTGPPLELVESWPAETSLDHPDLRDASDVWPELIRRSRRTLDLAEFYVSDEPGSRLSPVLTAIEDAARRGVKVRLLTDAGFYKTYPESLDRLAKVPGIEVRRYDATGLMGGVLHAKYFVVDGEEAFLGSQNFDWRALEHIQELGVHLRSLPEVRSLADVFETDWALAGGADPSTRVHRAPPSKLISSPKGWLPDETTWDLPYLVALIDGARSTVRVQLLTYKATGKDGRSWELDAALRRAAGRGVRVELMVSDWSKRPSTLEGLKTLPAGVTVKLVTIPEASRGFIPFARVIHAKYLVVDGARGWVGTSNWEPDYFYKRRNVGLLLDEGELPPRLDRFFLDLWESPYAERLDPAKAYTPPRISE